MKASINVDDLKRMLKNADKIMDRRGSSESISGKIVLSVHDGKFEVFALSTIDRTTELSQWVKVEDVYDDDFECICSVEDGAWTVSAKALAPLKAAKKGSAVVVSGDDGKVSITSPGMAFSVNAEQGIFGGAYLPAKFGDALASVELLPEDVAGFKYVAPALSDDETRPEFTGSAIRRAVLVATDGCRLHHYPLAGLMQEGTFGGIISGRLIRYIADGAYGTLTERRGKPKAWHVLEAPGMRLAVQEVDGTFPDFRKCLPRKCAVVDIDPLALADAVKLLCAGWKQSVIAMYRAGDGKAKLVCRPSGKNKGEPARECDFSQMDALGNGFPVAGIGIDHRYLLDALRGRRETIQFCYVDADSPLWFGSYSATGVYGWGAIVMPVQL